MNGREYHFQELVALGDIKRLAFYMQRLTLTHMGWLTQKQAGLFHKAAALMAKLDAELKLER